MSPAATPWPASRGVIATVWITVVVLAAVGLVAALGRTWGVVEGIRGPQPAPALSRLDEWNLRGTAVLLDAEPGTAAHERFLAESRTMLGKFNRHPWATLLHVAPAAVFMVLAPLQFSRRIRSRHVRWHRWSGRLLVALGVPIGLTGLYFGVLMPFGGLTEATGIAFFGLIFLFALVRAFVAIRRRDTATHREWMIRMFAIAVGVSAVRLAGSIFLLTTREGPVAWFGYTVWIGFSATLVAAELWIRATRRPRRELIAGVPNPPYSLPARPHVTT